MRRGRFIVPVPTNLPEMMLRIRNISNIRTGKEHSYLYTIGL